MVEMSDSATRSAKARLPSVEMIEKRVVEIWPSDKQMLFHMKFKERKKDLTVAQMLCFFLGGAGAHRFYLGEYQTGFIYVLFILTFIPAIVAFFELFTTLKPRVARYNALQALALMRQIDPSTAPRQRETPANPPVVAPIQ